MNDVSNRTIVALLVATVVISLGGTYISISAVNNKLTSIGLAPITGFAVVPNATATVTITGSASIRFTDSTVAFGSISVDTEAGSTNCTLSTLNGVNNAGCATSTEQNNGFTIENDGNVNLTVTLKSNVTAAQFIGLDSALFLWNVTVAEAGSCVNASGTARGTVSPNTSAECLGAGNTDSACGSIFEAVSTTAKVICPSLRFTDSSDSLNIDLNISIPSNAPVGIKLAGFIVTGTTEP